METEDLSYYKGITKMFGAVALMLVITAFIIGFLVGLAHADDSGEVNQTMAVIHHTASPDVSAQTIDQWHKERGWDGIGYHFVIRADGSVEEGRPANKKGAHARGRNDRIGIVLTGYDVFTPEQVSRLREILANRGIQYIENHHENCPGHGLNLAGIAEELGIEFKERR